MNDRLEPRIRILLGSSIAIGPGKAALLEAIEDTGSIAAAGRQMGMSYRSAWVLAKPASQSLGLVIRQDVDRSAYGQVNQDQAIPLSTTEGEIVDPQLVGCCPDDERLCSQQTA